MEVERERDESKRREERGKVEKYAGERVGGEKTEPRTRNEIGEGEKRERERERLADRTRLKEERTARQRVDPRGGTTS